MNQLIAPCGMNCALCQAYQGKGLACRGCGLGGERKACQNCSIRKCHKKEDFCFECPDYPCKRLKALDKRYRTKYQMSMLENLEFIRAKGLDAFVIEQENRYRCSRCGKLRTVHQEYCLYCAGWIRKRGKSESLFKSLWTTGPKAFLLPENFTRPPSFLPGNHFKKNGDMVQSCCSFSSR